MNRFTTRATRTAVIAADREAVWALVSDPATVAEATPFLHDIDDLGDGLWRWHLHGVPYPGGSYGATFTERMRLDAPERVTFEPEPSGPELAAATGFYALTPLEQPAGPHTRIDIRLEVSALLPAPRLMRPFVTATMDRVIAQMGARFAARIGQRAAVTQA